MQRIELGQEGEQALVSGLCLRPGPTRLETVVVVGRVDARIGKKYLGRRIGQCQEEMEADRWAWAR